MSTFQFEEDPHGFREDESAEEEDDIAPVVIIDSLLNEEGRPKHGGSKPGKQPNIDRGFDECFAHIFKDYFSPSPTYNERQFERRFRMSRFVFKRVVRDSSSKGKFDALGKGGLYALQKVIAALRVLTYGIAYDACDEYLRVSESSARSCLIYFCRELCESFEQEYLRNPAADDVARILYKNEERGLPGCVGSIDCQHWEWEKCPVVWAGRFKGKEKKPTVVLEAICDQELWIWHFFFGSPGCMNDINILDTSSTFSAILRGEFPSSCSYKLNNREITVLYYLEDGIYQDCPLFAKTFQHPTTNKEKVFSKVEEEARQDIERAFGVLTSRFHILKRPARYWHREHLSLIMKACIILHNMVVEDRRCNYESNMDEFLDSPDMFSSGWMGENNNLTHTELSSIQFPELTLAYQFARREAELRDSEDHFRLKHDLVEHVLQMFGSGVLQLND